MKYKIVGDSCCDFTAEDLKKKYISRVPLILTVGDTDVIDDDTFDQEKYLDMVDRCPECPRSSCPSPENYMQHFEGAENVFVVTLSSKLSGSYNSAMLAKQIYQENHPDVKIHVFDSKSAAVTANFFNSIGKSQLGIFMSLTRQILFLLPLIVIFPIFMGIDGVMYAGPIADVAAAVVCGVFTIKELRELSRLNSQQTV